MGIAITLLALAQGGGLPDAPQWVLSGSHPFENTGAVVENAGDVDGDGHSDLLVLSRATPAVQGVHGVGQLGVFRGGPNGFETTPLWVVRGDVNASSVSPGAAGIGDVNDDGYDDIAVAGFHSVAAYDMHVFYGGPNGVGGGGEVLLGDSDWTLPAVIPTLQGIGSGVLGPGDLDGDGIDDLLVGVHLYSLPGLAGTGAVLMFPRSRAGLAGGPVASEMDAT